MERTSRKVEAVSVVSPDGHYCASCKHLVRDPTPGSRAAKCCRYPPTPSVMLDPMGQITVTSADPPIHAPDAQWCGEWTPVKAAANG
jgi:hypothetical protein